MVATSVKRLKPATRAGRPPVPPGTPAEIAETIIWEAREPESLPPVPDAPAPPREDRPRHKLVVLGDSISQGFRSFAIHQTDLSWPAMVAQYGGITDFRYPIFDGPEGCAGLPLNIDQLIRNTPWPDTSWNVIEDGRFAEHVFNTCRKVVEHWESGAGARRASEAPSIVGLKKDAINHNLACWNYDLRDAFDLEIGNLQRRIHDAQNVRLSDHVGRWKVHATPTVPQDRSALITLAGGRSTDTAASLAKALGDDGGIETLVVALGANNILRTIVEFSIRWTRPPDSTGNFAEVDHKANYNAWTPADFRSEFDLLLEHVKKINAQNVIVFTVPHVTVVPMVRGVGDKMWGDRYFARYTRPWISDIEFRPDRDDCLTGDQVRVTDFTIEKYNEHIVQQVENLDTHDDRNWVVLDFAGMLDRLAYHRFLIDDQVAPEWWTPYELPAELLQLSPIPDTRFYTTDRFGRSAGGLIGLDGVHPTTIGYALIAREVMHLMTQIGVPLTATEPDWEHVIAHDTLEHDPLPQVDNVLELVSRINREVDLVQALLRHPH